MNTPIKKPWPAIVPGTSLEKQVIALPGEGEA
jgi:hypothetical protein